MPATVEALQAELAAVRAELEAAQATVAAQQDQVLRARADTENVRRRAQEDVSKARKFGIESFAESLVPVKDSLEAALAQPEQTVDALRSEEHTSELQSLMRHSYAVFCLQDKRQGTRQTK